MTTDMTKICIYCNLQKPIEQFASYLFNGERRTRNACRKCHNRRNHESKKLTGYAKTRAKVVAAKRRNSRASGEEPWRWLYEDCRRSDAKRGWTNDLTREVVAALIAVSCVYCGEDKLRRTLDRIDNDKPHVVENVLTACMRCNYLRRSLPFKAWMCLVDGLRKARELDLYEGWTGYTHKK